jgi:hypothetical protein
MNTRKKKISQILNDWDLLGFPPAGQWISDVKILVQVRNEIMHNADQTRVDVELCKKSLSAVKNLIDLLS